MSSIITIKAGENRGKPKPFGVFWNKEQFIRTIAFDESCKYAKDDERRIQKAWGVGFWPSHMQNSARIGWRYNPYADGFDIMAFVHDRGQLTTIRNNEVLLRTIGVKELCETAIIIGKTSYTFCAGDSIKTVEKTHNHKLQYLLGFYFEDQNDKPADHDMRLYIRK